MSGICDAANNKSFRNMEKAMKKGLLHRAMIAMALVTLLSPLTALTTLAQDKMQDKMGDKMGRMDKMSTAKVTVALIRADWCAACQKVDPLLAELREQYKDRINFVTLDVTTDEKTAEAAATARKLGLNKFFAANKKKTSTVVVVGQKNKILYKTDHNYDRNAYVKAFDEAIAKAS